MGYEDSKPPKQWGLLDSEELRLARRLQQRPHVPHVQGRIEPRRGL